MNTTKFLSIACLLSVTLAACAQPTAAPAKPAEPAKPAAPAAGAKGDPYVIGVLVDLNGPSSALGDPSKKTVELYAKKINDAGGVKGPDGKMHDIKLESYDGESDPAKNTVGMKALVDKKVLAVIGPTSTASALAVAPIATESKIPVMAVAAGIAVPSASPYMFQTAQNDANGAASLAGYFKAQGIKKIAILHDTTAFGQGGRDEWRKLKDKGEVEITYEGGFATTDTDVSSQISAADATKPQGMVVWTTVNPAAVVVKNWANLGAKTPIFFSHGIGNPTPFIKTTGTAANGARLPIGRIIVVNEVPDGHPQKALLTQYDKEWRAAYNTDPSTFGGHAYDGFMQVVRALETSGPDTVKLKETLESGKQFVGITGIFTYVKDNHNGLPNDSLVLAEIKNEKFQLIK